MENNVDQYNAIKAAIKSNLYTIRELLERANELNKIITELDDNVDEDEKKRLEDSMGNLYKSIDMLVIQTDSLFQSFIRYANSKDTAGV